MNNCESDGMNDFVVATIFDCLETSRGINLGFNMLSFIWNY